MLVFWWVYLTRLMCFPIFNCKMKTNVIENVYVFLFWSVHCSILIFHGWNNQEKQQILEIVILPITDWFKRRRVSTFFLQLCPFKSFKLLLRYVCWKLYQSKLLPRLIKTGQMFLTLSIKSLWLHRVVVVGTSL